jgi:hypothetical protein
LFPRSYGSSVQTPGLGRDSAARQGAILQYRLARHSPLWIEDWRAFLAEKGLQVFFDGSIQIVVWPCHVRHAVPALLQPVQSHLESALQVFSGAP